MRKIFVFLLLSCSWLLALAQGDASRLIDEGIALHDKNDFQGAIAKYDAALQLEPTNFKAQYEKSFSLMNLKKYNEAEEIIKGILKESKDPEYRRLSYINYGNIMDYRGEGKKSLKIYDDGIKEFPDSYLLYFNKGITQAGMKETADAIESFKASVQRNPFHASSHNALARLVGSKNRIPAVLSVFSFLLIESKGKRAEENRVFLNDLLMQGVERKDGGNVTINIDASSLDKKKNAEDDFGPAEMMLSLLSASNEIPDSLGAKTEADRLSYRFQLLIGLINNEEKKEKGFFKNFYVPFFVEMKKNDLVTIASYIVLSSSKDTGITAWLKENKDDVDGFYRWLENYQWVKK